MKLKIKLMALFASLLAFMPMMPTWAGGGGSTTTYYATLKASVSSSGGGTVYAGVSNSAGTYEATSTSDSQNSTIKDDDKTFYAFAKANEGFEFAGWSKTDKGTDLGTASPLQVTLSCNSTTSPNETTYYATFKKKLLAAFGITFVTSDAGTYTVDGAEPADKTGLTEVTSVKLASSDPNFLNWKVNDAVVNANPYTATCIADTTISAVFLTADQVAEVTTFADLTSALANDGKKKVIIPSGTELIVEKDVTLTIPAGKQLVVDGTLWALGTVSIGSGAQVTGNGSIVRSYKTVSQDATVHVPFPDGTDGVVGTASGVNGVDGTAGKYLVTSVKEDAKTITGSFSCKEEFVVTVENKASGKTFYTKPSTTKPVGVLCTTAREKALNWIDTVVPNDPYTDYPTLLKASETVSTNDTHRVLDNNKLVVLLTGKDQNVSVTLSVASTTSSVPDIGFIVDLAGSGLTLTPSSKNNQWNALKLSRFFNGAITVNKKVMNTNFCVYNCTGSFGYLSGSEYYTAISFYDSPNVSVTWKDMKSTTPADGQNFYGGATYSISFETTPQTKFNKVYWGTFSSKNNPTAYLYDTNKVTAVQDSSQSNAWVVKKIVIDPNKGQVKVNGQESTLADALANAKANDVIILQRDVELDSDLAVAAQNIRLDLSGWKLTGASAIVNNGDLEIIDSNGNGRIDVPVINNGTLLLSDAVYNGAITLNQGFCYFLAGTFNGGISVAQTVTDPTAIAEVVGGTYATLTYALGAENPQLVSLCKNGYVKDGKIAQIPESYVTSSTFASYQVKALSPNDETLYNRGGARSKYSREEWIRYKTIRASAVLFSSWGVDCAVTPDRKLAANDISVEAGGLYSAKVDEEIAANHAYSAFFQAMRKSGMASAPWTYGSILPGGENANKLKMSLENKTVQNGTIVAVEMRLATGVRNMSGPKDWSYTTYVTTSQKLLVFGNSSGNVAMIRPAEGAATFYADLASAMSAVADNGTVMLANDCATPLTLPKAGTYTFDPMCFEMTDVAPVVGEGLRIESTSTADSAAVALKPGAKATTYVVVDARVVEAAGGTKYASVAAAIAGETGNEIALKLTGNVTETVAVPVGKKVAITVAEGVEPALTVNPAEGAFLVETKNGATTTYEAKRITEDLVETASDVVVKKVEKGVTTEVSDATEASALIARLTGNVAAERVDNAAIAALDMITVTPTEIVDVKADSSDSIEAATFDVVPAAKEGLLLGETMLKFRLPVDAATDRVVAEVFHEGVFFGMLPVSRETVGETTYKFIEVTSNAFSSYGYELADYVVLPENQTIADWPDATPVKYGDTFYPTLQKAVEAAYDAGDKNIVIYCKPGATVGKMSHAHVVSDITVYGNGASVAVGGDADFEVDTYKGKGGPAGSELTGDITLNIDHLNGCAVWGQRNSDYKITVNMTGCRNVNRIYLSTAKGTIDINVDECSFVKANGSSANTSIKTDSKGTWKIKNSTFNDIAVAIAATNENGPADVTIADCTFIDCATTVNAAANSASDYASPIRVLGRAKTALKVDGCTFSYSEGAARNSSDVVIGELRANKAAPGVVSYEIVNTVGEIDVIEQHAANVTIADILTKITVTEATKATPVEGDNEAAVAKIGDAKFATLADAVAVAKAGDTIVLLADSEAAVELPGGVSFNTNGKNYTGAVTAADGYAVLNNDGIYTTAVAVAKIGDVMYATLEAAIAAAQAGETVTIVKDIKLAAAVQIGKKVALDLSTFTVTAAENSHAFELLAGCQLTVNADATNPGHIVCGEGKRCLFTDNAVSAGAKSVVINGGVFDGVCEFNPWGSGHSGEKAAALDLVINGGLFNDEVIGYRLYHATVNGGTFEKRCEFGTTSTCYSAFKGGKFKVEPGSNNPGAIGIGDDSSKGIRIFDAVCYESDGYFHVIKAADIPADAAAKVGTTCYYMSIEDALAKTLTASDDNRNTITLLKAADVTGLVQRKAIVIVPNGQTVTGTTTPAEENCFVAYDAEGNIVVLDDSAAVAQIGDVKYTSLAAAVATAGEGDTITMLKDVDFGDYGATALTIPADKKITLDLAGKQITGRTTATSGSYMIVNKGDLTVKDSVGGGRILAGADAAWHYNDDGVFAGSYASATIRNDGDITVLSGTIENAGEGSACYAIDSYGAGDVTITGGTLRTAKSMTVRLFYSTGSATISGGELISGTRYAFQVMGGTADVEISGGTFTSNNATDDVYALTTYNASDASIAITGGTFNGDIWVDTDGIAISGGSFAFEVPEDYCAEGFIPAERDAETGLYGVKEGAYVAQVGETKYESLADALKAAQSGDTIEILGGTWGAEAVGTLDAPGTYTNANAVRYKSLTIQPVEGATVTFTSDVSLGYDDSSTANATMTVKNLNFEGASLSLSNYVQVDVEGCTFTGAGNAAGALVILDSCCTNHMTAETYPASQVTVKGCTITGTGAGKPGIRLRNTGSVTLKGNTIVNSAHNGILFEANGAIDNAPVKTIAVTDNMITEWNAGDAREGGRAIRAALGALAAGSKVTLTGNTFRKAKVGLDAPDFVKITGVNAGTVDISGNDWNDMMLVEVAGNESIYTTDAVEATTIASVVTTRVLPTAFVTEDPATAIAQKLDVAYLFSILDPEDAEMQAIYAKIQAAGGLEHLDDAKLTVEEQVRVDELIAAVAPFADWHADFVVTFDRNIEEGMLQLAGQYELSNRWYDGSWVTVDIPTIAANTPYRLLGDGAGITESVYELLSDVVKFSCGVRNISAPAGTKMTVELRLYPATGNGLDAEYGSGIESSTIGSYAYILCDPVAELTDANGDVTTFTTLTGAATALTEGGVVTLLETYGANTYPQAWVSTVAFDAEDAVITADDADVAYRFDAWNPAVDSTLTDTNGAAESEKTLALKYLAGETDFSESEQARLAKIESELAYFIGDNWRNWHADFVVRFSKAVKAGSVELCGNYGNWETLSFALPRDVEAGENFRLLKEMAQSFSTGGNEIFISYLEILRDVVTFDCGVKNLDAANAGVEMTVELRLYKGSEGGNSEQANAGYIKMGRSEVYELMAPPVAQIGETTYTTLVDAFAAVAGGETITLLADASGEGIFLAAGAYENVTLDLNGKTYTVAGPAVGSNGTKSQAFHLGAGNTVTIKNGAIASTADSGVKMLVQNYANLTLEDVALDGMNLEGANRYVLSNNSGTVNLTGATSVTAKPGDVAIDACLYGSYPAPTVNLNTTGTVQGDVELTGGSFNYTAGTITGDVNTGSNYADSQVTGLKVRVGGDPADSKLYFDLQKALVAAGAAKTTATLLEDVGVAAPAEVTGELTLDLAGRTVAYTGETVSNLGVLVVHNGATLTITDTSDAGTGAIRAGTKVYAGVVMTKAGDSAAEPATLTLEKGTVEGYYYGIVGNGSRDNTSITVNGGTVTATAERDNAAIFNPQAGTVTINGGTITGYASAIEMRAGALTVTGGTLTATADAFSAAANASGNTVVGAAVAVSQHGTNKPLSVNITGGTFSGVKAVYEEDLQDETVDGISLAIAGGRFAGGIASENVAKFVSGGVFSEPVADAYCAEGLSSVANPDAATSAAYPYAVMSDMYVYDDEQTGLSVRFPRAWISSADGLGIPAAEATDAKIDETLATVQANGLPVWQNVLLGIDGANTAGLLATFAKDPASSAAEPKVVVTFKGLDAARQPTWETGVTVTYTLYTSADASSWTAVTEGATSTKAGVSYKMPTSSESVKTWLYQLRVNLEQKANQ